MTGLANGRGRVIRGWIATMVPVIAMLVAAIWWAVEMHFQTRENTRNIERQQGQIEINRDLIWRRTGAPGLRGGE